MKPRGFAIEEGKMKRTFGFSALLAVLLTAVLLASCKNAAGSSSEDSSGSSGSGGSVPSAPAGVAAAYGDAQASISWTAVSGATSYNIYWSTATGVTTSSGTKIAGVTSPYAHTGLTNGTTYYYIVTAVNGSGESAASSQVSAMPQASATGAPLGVAAASGNAQVTVSWTAVSGATSYNIYWSTTAGVTTASGTKLASVSFTTNGTTLSYTHTGLTNGTTYYYIVTAVNVGGESAASNQASAMPQVSAPGAPNGVSATPGNAQVTVSWTAVSGATSYNVYWSTTTGVTTASGTKLASVSFTTNGTTLSYAHTGLTNGTTYYYIVTAVNSGVESSASNQASATPQVPTPGTPTGLTASADSVLAKITLSWTAASGTITGYKIYRGTSGNESLLATQTGSGTTYTDTSLSAGTWYYKVSAYNAGGEGSKSSEANATGSVPGTPTVSGFYLLEEIVSANYRDTYGLYVDVTNRASINYNSSDPAPFEYKLSGTSDVIDETDSSYEHEFKYIYGSSASTLYATSCFHGSSLGTRAYIVTARAKNGWGWSAWSSQATITLPVAYPVQGLDSSNVTKGSKSLSLTWTKQSGTTLCAVWRFDYTASSLTMIGPLSSSVTSYTDTGLDSTHSYGYLVEAWDGSGKGVASEQFFNDNGGGHLWSATVAYPAYYFAPNS